MERHCSKCGAQLDTQWNFCPHCGGVIAGERLMPVEPEKPEPNPAPGAFTGLYFGIIAVPVLVVVGGLLCLTGLGAILGIPMIVAAVLAPLIGPMFGMRAHRGKCPHCGTRVTDIDTMENRECPVCNKRFSLRDHEVPKAA